MTYLLYLDDLNVFALNDEKLAEQLQIMKWYSDDIQMEFGLDNLPSAHSYKVDQQKWPT